MIIAEEYYKLIVIHEKHECYFREDFLSCKNLQQFLIKNFARFNFRITFYAVLLLHEALKE